jgi:hypothetical protein
MSGSVVRQVSLQLSTKFIGRRHPLWLTGAVLAVTAHFGRLGRGARITFLNRPSEFVHVGIDGL